MSRKKKRRSKDQSTTELMGIDGITEYSICTKLGDLVFFIIKPTNISVLPDASVSSRIYALLNVVKGQTDVEMLAMNSTESFESTTGAGSNLRSCPLFANCWNRTVPTSTVFRYSWHLRGSSTS